MKTGKGFKKTAVCGDIHFGESGNSKEHNEMCLEFLDWMIETAQENDCTDFMFLGDWHHHRNSINTETLNYSHQGIEKIAWASGFQNKYFILGNHDLPLRDSRRISSIPFLYDFSSDITVVNDPMTVGDTLLVPWLISTDDQKFISQIPATYVFGHFELPGFMMNSVAECKEHDGHLTSDWFQPSVKKIFSGHFHMRQRKVNKNGSEVWYIGNCFPHNFNDAGDRSRGFMILEHGGEPQFMDWPDMPTYDRIRLSEIDSPEFSSKINSRSSVKVIQDAPLSREDLAEIREILREQTGVMDLTIEPMSRSYKDTQLTEDMTVDETESMDETVRKFIMDKLVIGGEPLDRNVLYKIYEEASSA